MFQILRKAVQNLRPSYLEFGSAEEMATFADQRPDLVFTARQGENPNHYYCTARWRIVPREPVREDPLYRRQRIWMEDDMWRSATNLLRRLVGRKSKPNKSGPYPVE